MKDKNKSFVQYIVYSLILFLFAYFVSLNIQNEGDVFLYGKVTRVIDGDTLVVYLYNTSKEERIRLKCIDFPDLKKGRVEKWLYRYNVSYEKVEKCYYEGIEEIEKTILQKEVIIKQDKPFERDKYKRLLGYVIYNNTDINEYLINKGYAIPYICDKYKKVFTMKNGCLWN